MTRLSDLLRGAADRAPVGDVSVSLSRATRRVRAQRGVRGVGNGVAGLGAVALIALGVVQPNFAHKSINETSLVGAEAAPQADGAEFSNDSAPAALPRWMAWGECGSFPLQDYGTGGADAVSIAVDFDDGSILEGGTALDISVTVAANDEVDLTTSGPEAVVLWEGMVVAMLAASEAEQVLALAAGETVQSTASLELVDCFAGEPLPASKYEFVVSQAFFVNQLEPSPGPSPTPDPSPTPWPEPPSTTWATPDSGAKADPSPTPKPSNDPGPTPDVTASTVPDSDGHETIGDATDVEMLPVEPSGWDFRVTSEPLGFAVAGDPVDDPFADYFPQPWTPPVQPDDMLTPSIARGLFDAAVVSGRWDMAEGTSRWILPSGYGSRETFASTPAEESYYGCSWDGISGLTFPTRSADLGLLAISATAPSRVSLSYGWVVDGNPEVTLSVTNTSSYSIPGFFGEPNRSLYLVKGGRVVAEAYPSNIDPNRQLLRRGPGVVENDAAQDESRSYWGLLSPGESVSGTYLWRDVNRCSREDGSASNLSAGTYTLLAMQNLSLQQYSEDASVGGDVGIPEPALLDRDTIDDPAISTITVAPTQDDWLELQVWTSLGSVTITTR